MFVYTGELPLTVDNHLNGDSWAYSSEFISISCGSKELVKWFRVEWENEPDLLYDVIDAIQLAYEDPRRLVRLLNQYGKTMKPPVNPYGPRCSVTIEA